MGRKGHHKDQRETEDVAVLEDSGDDVEGAVVEEALPDERVSELEAELAAMKDRYLRSVADLENYRRRAAREAEDARKFANERLLTELMPVLDNMERAISAAAQTANFEALRDGVELTQRQFGEVLQRNGLSKVEALGKPFDPNLHEAIMQVEAEPDQEPGTVVEELRAGYVLNERVLRPTLVKVAS